MQRFSLLRRRWVLVLTAITVLGAAQSFAQEIPFRARATDELTLHRGSRIEGTSRGFAQPGGQFTAAWSGKFVGWRASGLDTWTFGGGDTLTWFWQVDLLGGGVSVGTYVVIGGTGRFANASGIADYVWISGEYTMEGTISY